MKEKPGYYANIPASVRYNSKLSDRAKLFYGEITALSNQTGECYASDQYFMRLYEVSRSTIQRTMKSLEDNDYIVRRVTYKPGTKEIDKRYIKITDPNLSVMGQPYAQEWDNPMPKNGTDSTTSINTTSNNTKDSVVQAPPYDQIVDYLNSKLGSDYQPTTKETQRHINARYKEGYNLDDFKQVIDTKVDEWIDRPDMATYLRPKTLFGTNFESYLNQPRPKKKVEEESVYKHIGVY